MQMRQLNYIVAIAECRTISKAAEKLLVSRSSLNGYLLQLEKELGTPLFYRNKKRLVPTFAGECYVAAAQNMLSIYDQMDDQLKEIKDSSAGQIKLGVNRSVGEQIFRHVFPAFHQQYPKYQIQLTVSESIEEALLRGEADWAITGHGSANPIFNELVKLPLGSYEIVLALPSAHPLAMHSKGDLAPYPPLDLKLFKNEKFILLRRGFNARSIADYHFSRAGFAPQILLECNSGLIASQLVKDGLGPSVVLDYLVANDPRVSYYSLSPTAHWTNCICYRQNTVFSKAERFFIDLVYQYVQNEVDVSLKTEPTQQTLGPGMA